MKERDHLENPDVDGRKLLLFIFEKWDCGDSSGSGQRQVAGYCEYGNELSGCIKYRKFLAQLRICKISSPWSESFHKEK